MVRNHKPSRRQEYHHFRTKSKNWQIQGVRQKQTAESPSDGPSRTAPCLHPHPGQRFQKDYLKTITEPTSLSSSTTSIVAGPRSASTAELSPVVRRKTSSETNMINPLSSSTSKSVPSPVMPVVCRKSSTKLLWLTQQAHPLLNYLLLSARRTPFQGRNVG